MPEADGTSLRGTLQSKLSADAVPFVPKASSALTQPVPAYRIQSQSSSDQSFLEQMLAKNQLSSVEAASTKQVLYLKNADLSMRKEQELRSRLRGRLQTEPDPSQRLKYQDQIIKSEAREKTLEATYGQQLGLNQALQAETLSRVNKKQREKAPAVSRKHLKVDHKSLEATGKQQRSAKEKKPHVPHFSVMTDEFSQAQRQFDNGKGCLTREQFLEAAQKELKQIEQRLKVGFEGEEVNARVQQQLEAEQRNARDIPKEELEEMKSRMRAKLGRNSKEHASYLKFRIKHGGKAFGS